MYTFHHVQMLDENNVEKVTGDVSPDSIHDYYTVYEVGEHGHEMAVADVTNKQDAALFASSTDMREALETMVEHAKEAHQHEIDKNHYGDKQPCSYCEDIKVANEAIAKARGEA